MFEENFKNRKADFNKLVEYGFVLKNKQYIYQNDIMDDKFTLFVCVDLNGDVSTSMIEKDFNEEYTLYKVERASGSFVGSVRLAVDEVLKDISIKCYKKSLYRYPQTELVIKYIKDIYKGELEFLWEKYLDYAVVRNKDNEKWYILIAPIPRNKLIKGTQGDVEIINVLIPPEKSQEVVDYHSIFPAYHMNKKSWISIILDGSLDIEEIYKYIDQSYQIAKNK